MISKESKDLIPQKFVLSSLKATDVYPPFIAYFVSDELSGPKPLVMESHAKGKEDPAFICGEWDSAQSLDEFLRNADLFFTEYTSMDPDHSSEVHVVATSGGSLREVNVKRSIGSKELLSGFRENIGNQEAEFNFLRVENNVAGFTWEQGKTGLLVSPNDFLDQGKMGASLARFYEVSGPTVPVKVFERLMTKVSSDEFQVKQK